MRTIKFRAWDKEHNKMINNFTIEVKNGDIRFPEHNDNFGSYSNDGDYILMQFTGLKDKHGQDIYEGDILIGESDILEYVGIVFFCKQTASFMRRSNLKINGTISLYPLQTRLEIAEIKGNIFENKELLEKYIINLSNRQGSEAV